VHLQGTRRSEAVQVQLVIVFGSIISAIVATIGVVIVATLNRTSTRQKRTTVAVAQVLDHVQNAHKNPDGTPLNLRDDLDDKFEGLAGLVKGISADLGGVKADIRGIRKDASDDRRNATEALASERERILILERTLTPAQRNRLRTENKE
jgi:hypothetical protein